MENIIFRDEKHKEDYQNILKSMNGTIDEYKKAVAYLIALDDVVLKHANDIFDFDECCIKGENVLERDWQTGTSRRTTALLIDLWNGFAFEEPKYTVTQLFDCVYAKYYLEAIKIRFWDGCL